MAGSANFVGTPKVGLVQIVAADASTKKTLITAGASGSKVVSLYGTSDDTVDRLIQVYRTRAAVDYLLCSRTIRDLSGSNDATDPTVNLLQYLPSLAWDSDGQKYFFLESGDTLRVMSTTTVTAAKAVSVHADYGDF